MEEIVKDSEVPQTSGDEIVENDRTALEKSIITENETIPQVEVPKELVPEEEKTDEVVSEDPVDRIKKSVQKRIDKVVAQKKSVEDELAEAKAELERLKANSQTKESDVKKDDTPPTPEDVEAYIIKMREDGNVKEEVAAMRYLVKLEKELALKEVEEKQNKTVKESEAQKAKQLSDWTNLSRDYVAYSPDGKVDPKSDLNLANQDGLLYKTALSLYNDKELHADFYNDPDVIQGFRRAVSDAYREIHQQGLIKTPKGESILESKKNSRMALAEPDSDSSEETSAPKFSNSLSDAEKVREEIRSRNRTRTKR